MDPNKKIFVLTCIVIILIVILIAVLYLLFSGQLSGVTNV